MARPDTDQAPESAAVAVPVLERFRLEGRVAVVTGGAGTIGSSLCRGLADAGATVVVASRRADRCRALADDIERGGGMAVGLPLDLAEPASIQALRDSVMDRFGQVDVLVNNAISQIPGHVEELSIEAWEGAMRIDATGWFRITQLFLRDMLAAGCGNIISIASILGIVSPDPRHYPTKGVSGFRPTYFFVKAGIVSFTRFLAATYGDRGIRANCVSPGSVETNPPRTDPDALIDRTPMRRLAQPDDLQGAVVYLASDASAYVTGHNLVVDGGYTAW